MDQVVVLVVRVVELLPPQSSARPRVLEHLYLGVVGLLLGMDCQGMCRAWGCVVFMESLRWGCVVFVECLHWESVVFVQCLRWECVVFVQCLCNAFLGKSDFCFCRIVS